MLGCRRFAATAGENGRRAAGIAVYGVEAAAKSRRVALVRHRDCA